VEKIVAACTEAVAEAESQVEKEAAGTSEVSSEMQFSPDDQAEPKLEDY